MDDTAAIISRLIDRYKTKKENCGYNDLILKNLYAVLCLEVQRKKEKSNATR